jgi:hypothetical protein
MTDAQFLAWFQTPASLRVVLVEAVANVSGVETTFYMSNRPYVTGSTDTPASTAYVTCITGGLGFSESLDLGGGAASMSWGDIEIENNGGVRDTWLNYVWANRQVQVFVGDVRWARSDFRKVFDGVIGDMGSRDQDVLNLKLLDKLQRLNNPLTETTLGGTTNNKDRLLPLTFGEVFNVTPLLTNPATLEYQVHNGSIEDIIEVRSNGAVPVSITKSVGTGKFTLSAAPNGAMITCSVQGDKLGGTYTNNISTLVQRIVQNYGPAYARFTAGDLDSTNLSAFATANTQPVGLYVPDRMTVLEACQTLAGSVGAQVVMTSTGLLRLIKVDLPASGTPTVVTQNDLEYHGISIDSRPPVVATVKLGYCKNWTPQEALAGGVAMSSIPLYQQEWLTVTANDSTTETTYKSPRRIRDQNKGRNHGSHAPAPPPPVAPPPASVGSSVSQLYKLHGEPEQQNTMLLVASDATTEANRRLTLWKTPRTVFRLDCRPHLLLTELGDAITIQHPRYGLSAGKTGIVVSIERDWVNGKVSLGVLV